MSEPEHKDPRDMSAREIALKLWQVAVTEDCQSAPLLLWIGVACAALMQAERELNPEFPSHG